MSLLCYVLLRTYSLSLSLSLSVCVSKTTCHAVLSPKLRGLTSSSDHRSEQDGYWTSAALLAICKAAARVLWRSSSGDVLAKCPKWLCSRQNIVMWTVMFVLTLLRVLLKMQHFVRFLQYPKSLTNNRIITGCITVTLWGQKMHPFIFFANRILIIFCTLILK